ncbi:DUF5062 family protein [Shewanella sp. NIFS-20-20]|uniref:DUF5062 family protein n=1 Tax=Shewanella sp. NIFS-20-20 TaxID=2853806 RepID=UPI001C4401D1|nr:DUF5062 family protein [Shewanella sp. NIFS-20-20]MBV7314091.1 DUF5062 family protein [Shewanella sp. NIFS-20-20]
MKKNKHDAQLFKTAIKIGLAYAVKRGYSLPDSPLSDPQKAEIIYRLLVQDKLITPLPQDKEDGPQIKHRLIVWISKQLPAEHPLLN